MIESKYPRKKCFSILKAAFQREYSANPRSYNFIFYLNSRQNPHICCSLDPPFPLSLAASVFNADLFLSFLPLYF